MSLTWIKPSMPLETLVPGDLGPVNEPVGDSDIDEEPEARDIRDCPVEHLTSLRRRDATSFRRRRTSRAAAFSDRISRSRR